MAHNTYDFTAGDTGSKIRVRMIDELTGAILQPFNGLFNAYIKVKPEGGALAVRTMAVLSGANDGYAEYQFLGSELVLGTLQTQVQIQRISDGTVVSQLGIEEHEVGPQLS